MLGQAYSIEYRILRRDGKIRYVVSNAEPIFDTEGHVAGIFGTTQDLTEKKLLQLEAELKQEEINKMQRRFSALIKESVDVFEILDPDGRIVYIS